MCAIINVATPNYSVCTCTVIGNGYILWSYYSSSLKMIRNDFLSQHLHSLMIHWKLKRFLLCFPLLPLRKSSRKATRELRILRFDLASLTWIINKTLHQLIPLMCSSCWRMPAANVAGPGTRECSRAECSVPPLSLFAAHGSQCVLRSQVGSCDDHHDHLPVTADAAHQDDCSGHLGQDDGLLSQR